MIVGTGVDILQISRIKLDMVKRILSEEELKVFNNLKLEKRKREYLAGRFSVKEAIMKALSGTEYVIGLRDITVLNDETGRPYVKKPTDSKYKFSISISHELEYCVGFCMIESV